MASNFPASLDTFTNPSSTDAMDSVSVPHASQHSDLNDAVEALQAKVGADSSGVASSHDYKIAQLESGATGGKIIAVKHAELTATQSASLASGARVSVTDLSITHTLAESTNKLIISAYLGAVGGSEQRHRVGLAIADGGTLIQVGNASGSKTQVGSAGSAVTVWNQNIYNPSLQFVYSPGDTASHTYTVEAINYTIGTQTVYINRTEDTTDDAARPLAASAFIIQEVSA